MSWPSRSALWLPVAARVFPVRMHTHKVESKSSLLAALNRRITFPILPHHG